MNATGCDPVSQFLPKVWADNESSHGTQSGFRLDPRIRLGGHRSPRMHENWQPVVVIVKESNFRFWYLIAVGRAFPRTSPELDDLNPKCLSRRQPS